MLNFVAQDIKTFTKHPKASFSIDSGPFEYAGDTMSGGGSVSKKKNTYTNTPRTIFF